MSKHKPGHTMRIAEIRESKKAQRELLDEYDDEYDD